MEIDPSYADHLDTHVLDALAVMKHAINSAADAIEMKWSKAETLLTLTVELSEVERQLNYLRKP